MTRPSIIRADTIDLQDHEAPSTQSQSKRRSLEPHTPGIDARDYIAPHQAETLREVALESAEENLRSPRLASDSNANGYSHSHDNDPEHTLGGDGGYLNQAMDAYRQHEQGALAAAHDAGGGSSSDEDLDEDTELDDDMMDKISSSPSIEDEDIDFEFVYALHTFVATVEGQANATKGDTMVLLDDSNSYWWLVRVVKDSSIGYLPAEHIETPTERLARLNKHRNIDLSATMLGDQAPKQKTGFGILRKKKTVVFTDPTYVDYSDIDYSTDEEDIEELFGVQGSTQQKQETQQKEAQRAADAEPTDEAAKVEPLRTKDPKEAADSKKTQDPATAAAVAAVTAASTTQEPSAGQETADAKPEEDEEDDVVDDTMDGPSRSRNGTVRNTDSFFKDSSETKKITLTPNLLRDDSASSPPAETANKDVKGPSSFENKMDRELVADKDKRKSKDKKPSAIRSFFSRKDKKRTSEDDDESFGKRSMDIMSDPRDSEEQTEDPMSPEKSPHGGRAPGKLQKPQPRIEPSNARKVAVGASQRATVELSSYLSEGRTNDVSSVPPASMRIVDADTQESREVSSNDQQTANRDRSGSTSKSPFSKIVPKRSPSGSSESKPQKTTKAKTRMELDVSSESESESNVKALADSPEETPSAKFPTQGAAAAGSGVAGAGAVAAAGAGAVIADKSNTSQQMSQTSQNNASNPPALVADTSSAEGRSPEASPSPELSQAKDGSTTSSAREQWNDLKLRAFFDESEHIRDLLAVVYDKSDVDPVGVDHPIAGGLFREQNAKLAEITTQLDNLLGDWLARKQRLRGTG